MVHRVRQLLATLCVASSLALVALGGSNTIGGFCLRILSFGRPHNNCGAHFGYGCRIPLCKGCVVRGVGSRIKSFLLRLSSTCYKAGMVGPAQPTSSRMTSHHFSASFPVAKNKEKNRETVLKENGGGCRAYRVLSFSPFYSMVESSWPALKVIEEHLQNLIRQGI
jgi:hypothetical protein